MSGAVKLEPCPWCGVAGSLSWGGADYGYGKDNRWWRAECKSPFCPTAPTCASHASEADAVAAWNRRAQADHARRVVECVEGASVSEALDDMATALHRIADWARAYPTDIFAEVSSEDWRRGHEVMEAAGLSLSRCVAAETRRVVSDIGKIALAALPPPPESEGERA